MLFIIFHRENFINITCCYNVMKDYPRKQASIKVSKITQPPIASERLSKFTKVYLNLGKNI